MVYVAALLWSINARLGGESGADLPPLSLAWTGDVVRIAVEDGAHLQEIMDDQEEEMLRSWARMQD